ncbi:MAG: DUF748 domain-containing protein [Humidesulfovibrio sp.]|nr:DUF748 domain-containing protein [Humidesulfovibrio sp.]
MEAVRIPPQWLRRFRIFALGFLVLAVFFGAFGYFAGPPLARSFLTKTLAQQLRRPVTLGAIHINPYAMSVRVEGLKVGDGNGGEAFAFDELFVNLNISSIIHAAPVIEEFRLKGPRIHVARVAPDRYDISDLLDEWLKPDDKPTPKFSVNNIKITDGRVDFDDRPMGRRHTVTDINIALPFISNLAYQADKYTEPSFSAVINGAPLKLNGKSKPFAVVRESELKLDLNHFELTPYLAYLPFPLPFTVAGGQVDTDLSLVFRQPPKEVPTLDLAGRVTLSGLRLLEGKKPLLNLAKLDVPLAAVAPLSNRFQLGAIGIDGLEVFVRTQREGGLNWQALAKQLPGSAKAAPAKTNMTASKKDNAEKADKTAAKPEPPKPMHLAVAGLRLSKATLRWQDDSGRDAGPSATLASFEVKDIQVDVAGRHVRVGSVGLDGLNITATRLADGRIAGLQGPAAKPTAAPIASQTAKKPRQAAKTAPGWLVEIAKTAVANTGLRLEDKAVRPASTQTLDITKLTLDALSTASKTTATLDLAMLINKKGVLAVSGPVQLTPLVCKLKVDLRGFELLPLQPYFADKVNLTVTKGQINGGGELTLNAAPDGSLAGGWKGQLTLGDFHSVDKVNSADFLTWKSLHLGGMNVALKPFSVAIGEIALSDFYARLIVSPEGKLNILQLVKKNAAQAAAAPEGKPEGTPMDKTAPVPATQAAAAPATPVRIAKVTLQGGTVSFTDHFIKPNYSAKLGQIGGRITGLSSDPGSTADMDLRGAYEGAPLTITGKLNPLSATPALDIKTEVRGVELTPMSPYFGKYAGYALEKGKLSLYLSYKIADRKLSAENRVFLDQLTFGDKVASPDATKLPVTLAVALLKNRRGEIDINLPISGSLDDPQFSVGGIVVQVILNLLGKAVTAPFALLGSLFSGGEELSHVDFAPGRALLAPDAVKRLESLAKALDDRPALTLEVAGSVDPEKDREGLRQAWLEHEVKASKLALLVKLRKEAGSVNDVVVDPKEYPALLEQAYKREKFPKPRNFIGLTKSLPQAEMEKLMLANAPVGDEDLRALANRRATAVADWLRVNGKIPAERVFLLPPKPMKQSEGEGGKKDAALSRVDFSLK